MVETRLVMSLMLLGYAWAHQGSQSFSREKAKECKRFAIKSQAGFSLWQMWDQCQMRAMPKGWLVQREEMTWLSWPRYVFVPWPPGQVMAGIQKGKLHSSTCHQPPLHPFLRKVLCTSWLLPETIRSPLVPFALLPGMSSPSPNATSAPGRRKVMNQNHIPFSFARLLSQIWISHQIWGRGFKQHVSGVILCLY